VADEANGTKDASMPPTDQALPRHAHVPPPSADLLAVVARGGAVATRRPVRTLAAVAGLSLGWAGALLFLVLGLRADLLALPVAPVALYTLACFTGFVAQLGFALVPSPRRILPSGTTRYSGPVGLVVPRRPGAWRAEQAQPGRGVCSLIAVPPGRHRDGGRKVTSRPVTSGTATESPAPRGGPGRDARAVHLPAPPFGLRS
jgi:hypothetical protein